jgi:RimJ/RimL family protein N-acetyltransferase
VIGSTRFYEIDLNHKHLAIGYTWYIPEVWGTGINTECKLLLLKYAFETLLMNRVEFYIDARNERSRAAVKKLGAKEEGVLREHIILEDGYVRDTVVYSILAKEWKTIYSMLIDILGAPPRL